MKIERKNNLKRKQETWKEQIKNAKRPKPNPAQVPVEGGEGALAPIEAVAGSGEVEVVQPEIEVGYEKAENDSQQEKSSDLSDLEDIFGPPEPRKKAQEQSNNNFDELEDFLDGFSDDELDQFL